MPSSTTARASHRLLLRAMAARVQRRYRGAGGRPSGAGGFSSQAGLHRRPWLARLRRALENDLFVLHYQPIVSLLDGGVSHYEALVRLADEPHGRLVGPGSFLPAAERYGLVREIDRLVLGKVLALLAEERDERGASVAINVSTLSVTDGAMLTRIERGLARRGVDPSRLIVEVTETAAISDMGRARAFCEGVQALGCGVALDDFGSGFGSFQYLKNLPFDFLKIDGDFIRALPVSTTDQLVVKALANVVRGMGRLTIAEFVGDGATLALLHDYGVDYAQGFAVGRPAPRAAVPV
ncbi:MAG TPA: EAL domain-containing protein [Solirubrobacteraceae bacterium]|jgi:EAL domain-containing protein (putative c-di-GMP-specific phosphodiesterase class I)|nr:EAL domain-containing protein [Solirubrobacteraceae bacterium]